MRAYLAKMITCIDTCSATMKVNEHCYAFFCSFGNPVLLCQVEDILFEISEITSFARRVADLPRPDHTLEAVMENDLQLGWKQSN